MPTISMMFDYFPGNHGLTEEIIYNYKPTSSDDRVPIFSGSQDNIIPIGYIRNDAHNKEGKLIVYFEGPCLILTKDGSAGLLTYRGKEDGIFTINHHACVLKLKGEWEGEVDLEWFALQYERRLYQYVSSKSDNAVFSTEWFDKIHFEVPDYNVQLKQKDKKKKIGLLTEDMHYLSKLLEKISKNTQILLKNGDVVKIDDIVHFKGGNSGLTEEFIYYNKPNSDEEKIPILSSATLNVNLMGHISKNARPDGKALKIFRGPCILVARNGYAGTMTYIESGAFTTNDHAYVIRPNKAWEDKINLRWFAQQYQELFYNLVTSKSDNATFNKEYAEKQTVEIPEINVQNSIATKLLQLDKLLAELEGYRKKFEGLIEYEIVS